VWPAAREWLAPALTSTCEYIAGAEDWLCDIVGLFPF
jgi:hypothetical protein